MRSTIIALVCATALLSGQAPKAQRQDILDYQLNLPLANRLITAMEAMTKYVVSLPDFKERLAKKMKMTPAEQIAAIEKDPKAMAIVKQNGLTAADYVAGVPALRMALAVASGGPANPNFYASPANVAFAKANLAQLKPKMDAADGMPPAMKK